MTETFTTSYIDIDSRWDARALPRAFESEATISAWTTDEDLDAQADSLAVVYATDADDLHDLLHGVRTHLRAAALAAAASPLVTVAVVVTSNMDHLIDADTTDAELRTLADAAEAGAGGPIPELLEELVRLRDAERVVEVRAHGPERVRRRRPPR
ncbi:hypothetical protein ACLXNF_19520 [Mycobacteroides chelonae]|uniref:hypothetical protein n=1 Tax=Mycobacteroides chelonae TaxID=1774 RepID=UPI0039EA4AB8